MKQKLQLQDFEVWVFLGCSREEQELSQPVHFNLDIDFEDSVSGSKTDQLEETVDYVKLASIIKIVATEKKFQLVEHLSFQCFTGVLEYLKSRNIKAKLKLSVKKIRVPIENLKNGVVFTCETKL